MEMTKTGRIFTLENKDHQIILSTYFLPKDGVLFITPHRQGVTLKTQVHGRVVVPDIRHVLPRGKVRR